MGYDVLGRQVQPAENREEKRRNVLDTGKNRTKRKVVASKRGKPKGRVGRREKEKKKTRGTGGFDGIAPYRYHRETTKSAPYYTTN